LEAGFHGEGEAEIGSVVEGRCEESAGVVEESVVGHSGGEEVAPVARRRRAEGDETQDSISIDSAEGGVGEPRGPAGQCASNLMAIKYRDY
jgi:hypothetical protein